MMESENARPTTLVKRPLPNNGSIGQIAPNIMSRVASAEAQEFMQVLNHKLSQPLTALRCCLELMEQSAAEGGYRERVGLALEQADRVIALLRLFDNLVEADHPAQNARRICLTELVAEVLEELRPAGEFRNVRINYLVNEQVFAWACPVRIRQAIWNILADCVDKTRPGGAVLVAMHAAQPHAELVVADGSEVTAGQLARQLNPFATSTDKSDAGATEEVNFPLAVAQRIIVAANGRMKVELNALSSRLFYISLPIES